MSVLLHHSSAPVGRDPVSYFTCLSPLTQPAYKYIGNIQAIALPVIDVAFVFLTRYCAATRPIPQIWLQ